MVLKYQEIGCCLLIFLFISSVGNAADQWDKHKVAASAIIGGLSGGIVGAAAGYIISNTLDFAPECTNSASMGIAFPVGFTIGTYVGAQTAINKLYFPDELNAGKITLYSLSAGLSGYLLWRWVVKKYGYEKGVWSFWSIIPLALLGARIGTNNTFYLPLGHMRF